MDNASTQQYSTRVDLNDFLYDLTTVGIEPIIPRILMLQNANSPSPILKASGCGAFRHAMFVGWLNAKQTRGLLWLRNRPGKSLLRFPWQDGTIVVESDDLQTNIQTQLKKKVMIPSFRIDVHISGKIVMYTGDRALTTEDIPSIQRAWKKEIEHTILSTIQRAKKLRTDVIGFGNVFYCSNPRLYKAKFMTHWDERFFPQSMMMLHVENKIIAIGMTNHRP
jgi:spore germination protein KC